MGDQFFTLLPIRGSAPLPAPHPKAPVETAAPSTSLPNPCPQWLPQSYCLWPPEACLGVQGRKAPCLSVPILRVGLQVQASEISCEWPGAGPPYQHPTCQLGPRPLQLPDKRFSSALVTPGPYQRQACGKAFPSAERRGGKKYNALALGHSQDGRLPLRQSVVLSQGSGQAPMPPPTPSMWRPPRGPDGHS